MARKGRNTELIVEELEKLFLNNDYCKIKSPDSIKDIITGNFREVDVSIRCNLGTHEFLTVIECRDWKDQSQDVTWIEQIHTKTQNIKANRVIAVSTSGFSKNASKKANFYNIILRTLKEFKSDDILDWNIKLISHVGDFKINNIKIFTEHEISENNFINLLRMIRSNTKCVKDKSNGKFLTFNQIVLMINDENDNFLFKDLIDNDPPINKNLDINLSKNEFYVEINKEEFKIEYLRINLECWMTSETIPFSNILNYDEGKTKIIDKFDYNLTNLNNEAIVSILKNYKTGELKLIDNKNMKYLKNIKFD